MIRAFHLNARDLLSAFGFIVTDHSAKVTSGPIEDLIAHREHRYFVTQSFAYSLRISFLFVLKLVILRFIVSFGLLAKYYVSCFNKFWPA